MASIVVVASVGTVSAADPPAAADPQVLASAQTLYGLALKAMDRKDFATACPKLEEVTRLVPDGMGAKVTLAECYQGAGRLASAWTIFTLVEAAATNPSQAQHKRAAHKAAEALQPRLAQLSIEVPDTVRGLSGLEITRDGVLVGPGQWGTPLPVDRGTHVVAVVATGKVRQENKVEVEDGSNKSVKIADLASVPVETPPPPPRAVPEAPVGAPEPDAAGKRATRRTAGFVVGGVGVAALGVGAGFGVLAIVKKKDANSGSSPPCLSGTNYCSLAGVQLRSDGVTAGNVSTALFVVGGLAAAGGVTLVLTAPSVPNKSEAVLVVGIGGMVARGSW